MIVKGRGNISEKVRVERKIVRLRLVLKSMGQFVCVEQHTQGATQTAFNESSSY